MTLYWLERSGSRNFLIEAGWRNSVQIYFPYFQIWQQERCYFWRWWDEKSQFLFFIVMWSLLPFLHSEVIWPFRCLILLFPPLLISFPIHFPLKVLRDRNLDLLVWKSSSKWNPNLTKYRRFRNEQVTLKISWLLCSPLRPYGKALCSGLTECQLCRTTGSQHHCVFGWHQGRCLAYVVRLMISEYQPHSHSGTGTR